MCLPQLNHQKNHGGRRKLTSHFHSDQVKVILSLFLYFTVYSAKLNLWKNEVEKIKEKVEESQRRKRRDIDYEMHYGHDKSGPAFGKTIFDEFMTGGSGDYDQVLLNIKLKSSRFYQI